MKLTPEQKAKQWESAADHLERALDAAPPTIAPFFGAELAYQRETVVASLRRRATNIRRRGGR
jgi:hypothetical protein